MIVIAAIGIHSYSGGYSFDDTRDYDPTDTRIIPFSTTLCQSLKLELSLSSSAGYITTLYMLSSPPTLTGNETFTVSKQRHFTYNDYVFYYYYLHPGSSFNLSTCVIDSKSVTFYLFKGHDKFKKWRNNEHSHSYEKTFVIQAVCGSKQQNFSYQVDSESDDYYYLVFDGTKDLTAAVEFNLAVFRTQYELPDYSNVTDSCSRNTNDAIDKECSVSVAFSGGGIGFVTVQPSDIEPDYAEDEIDLSVVCGPRYWLYAVICVSALVGLMGILVVCVCVCVCVRRKRQQPVATTSSTTTTAADPVAPLLPDDKPTPPVNPYYGSNVNAPPAYNP